MPLSTNMVCLIEGQLSELSIWRNSHMHRKRRLSEDTLHPCTEMMPCFIYKFTSFPGTHYLVHIVSVHFHLSLFLLAGICAASSFNFPSFWVASSKASQNFHIYIETNKYHTHCLYHISILVIWISPFYFKTFPLKMVNYITLFPGAIFWDNKDDSVKILVPDTSNIYPKLNWV